MSGLVPPPNPPPPFDMVYFMHMSASYDMNKVFRLAEDVPWHSCAFVSVLEEYTGPQRPGELLILLIILIYLFVLMSLIVLSLL